MPNPTPTDPTPTDPTASGPSETGPSETGPSEAAAVADRVARSVVRIGRGPGRGAGLVAAPGVVVTNAHNLRGGETTVTWADGHQAVGAVAAVDTEGDLAAITIDTAGAPPLEWSGAAPGLGQAVYALAVPVGGGLRITRGAVSATGRRFRGPGGRLIEDAVEHTAPLAPGSSGGPVVDAGGRLLGISTHRLGDGFYLAVPVSDDLRARVGRLAAGEAPSPRRLGVALVPGRAARRIRAAAGLPERDGVLVQGVEASSPAERSGLRQGDLLVSAGGRPLRSLDDLAAALDAVTDGTLALAVVRAVDEMEVTVHFDAET